MWNLEKNLGIYTNFKGVKYKKKKRKKEKKENIIVLLGQLPFIWK